MKVALVASLLWIITPSLLVMAQERPEQFEVLKQEYEQAVQEFRDRWANQNYLERSVQEKIEIYEDWPAWNFIPRYLELAKADPTDGTAFDSCLWIISQTGSVGNDDQGIFEADQHAWTILSDHHTHHPEVPKLCFTAANRDGPAQEQFLRKLMQMPGDSREWGGFATLSLAELLARRYDTAIIRERRDRFLQKRPDAFNSYLIKREHPVWNKHVSDVVLQECKDESIRLFQTVLRDYDDIPVTISEPSFRNLENLGEKASKSLHALQHLSIGSKAPEIAGTDLNGEPLKLEDFRGQVVVLSFWFPGCGPCIALVPQEKQLLETYQDEEFALLGICRHEDAAGAIEVAHEHQMDWPCWFDGAKGPIVRDWNILSWPSVYVLDRNGVIVAKQIQGEELDVLVAELMHKKTTD